MVAVLGGAVTVDQYERLLGLIGQLSRGPFGRQAAVIDLCKLVDAISVEPAAIVCPDCAKRKEQNRARVAKCRNKGRKKR
jgi:hypothetical protein